MTVIAESLRLAKDLTAIVEEETERLTNGESASSLRTLVESKTRLTEQFEQQLRLLKQTDPAVIEACPVEERDELKIALARLSESTIENGKIIIRKQALTDDLLGAVVEEARRSNGATIMRYGDTGSKRPGHRSAAVAVDTRL